MRDGATDAMRSLPELHDSAVISTGKPQPSAWAFNSALSVHSTTASTLRAWRQRSRTRWIIGLPPMSARTLLGSREDCNRAGTATTHLRIAINPRASLHRRER